MSNAIPEGYKTCDDSLHEKIYRLIKKSHVSYLIPTVGVWHNKDFMRYLVRVEFTYRYYKPYHVTAYPLEINQAEYIEKTIVVDVYFGAYATQDDLLKTAISYHVEKAIAENNPFKEMK